MAARHVTVLLVIVQQTLVTFRETISGSAGFFYACICFVLDVSVKCTPSIFGFRAERLFQSIYVLFFIRCTKVTCSSPVSGLDATFETCFVRVPNGTVQTPWHLAAGRVPSVRPTDAVPPNTRAVRRSGASSPPRRPGSRRHLPLAHVSPWCRAARGGVRAR